MSTGADNKTMPVSKEYEAGYKRVFGNKKPKRGRWIWDARQGRLVPADQYVAPSEAVSAPIMSGRFYENTAATDGTDIGSRKKHREYMRANGLSMHSDYSDEFRRRVKADRERADDKNLVETVERAFHQRRKP